MKNPCPQLVFEANGVNVVVYRAPIAPEEFTVVYGFGGDQDTGEMRFPIDRTGIYEWHEADEMAAAHLGIRIAGWLGADAETAPAECTRLLWKFHNEYYPQQEQSE